MNQNPSTTPETSPEFAGIAARATAGVRTHQNFLRVLTGTAFVLGFLAVAASVLIVCAYFVLYRPKEKEVLLQVTLAAEQAKARATPSDNEAAPPPKLPFDFPSVQATMTFFHSVVIAGLAAAVGILALGTLVLLAVVVLGRRATLQQINLSLTQISTQLRALQAAPGQK
jgi:hypothetical protein